MFKEVKRTWRGFKARNPGHRFQQQFSHRQVTSRSPIQKALFVAGGLFLIAAGCLFLFVPGPGLVVLLIGAFLIAQQSLIAARALDWTEIRLRNLLSWSRRAWRRSPPTLKILFIIVAAVLVGVVGLGAFKFLISEV
jgi:hypothetical protein